MINVFIAINDKEGKRNIISNPDVREPRIVTIERNIDQETIYDKEFMFNRKSWIISLLYDYNVT